MNRQFLLGLAVSWVVLGAVPAAAAQIPCQTCYTAQCPNLQSLVPACPLRCPSGKVPLKGRHCCWPGQTFGRVCTGSPTSCPDGFAKSPDECTLQPCNNGRTRSPDGIHCCWPGQTFDPRNERCAGRPQSCPLFLVVSPGTDECVAAPACPAGQTRSVASAGHCCWVGQTWTQERCSGPPAACPADYFLDADNQRCTKAPRCPAGQSFTAATKGHCCWPGQAWDHSQCAGLPASCPPGYFTLANSCEKGPASCPVGKEWSQATAGHCCWLGQSWQNGSCQGQPQCRPGYQPTRTPGGAERSVDCALIPCQAAQRRDAEGVFCVDKPPRLDKTSHRDNHEFLALFSTSGAAYYGWAGSRAYTASTVFGTKTANSDPVGAFAWSHKLAYTHRMYFNQTGWNLQLSGAFTYTLLVPTQPIGCGNLTFLPTDPCNSAPGVVQKYPPPPAGHDLAVEGTVFARHSVVGLGLVFGAEFYANGPQASPYALPIGPMISLYRERFAQFRIGWRPVLGSLYDLQTDLTFYSDGKNGHGHFAANFYYVMKARDTTDPLAVLGAKLLVTAGLALGFYFSQ